MRKTDQELCGIGGWLILLAVAVVGMPGNLLRHSEWAGKVYAAPAMQRFLLQGSPDFDPRWQAVSFIDTVGFGVAVIPAAILAVFFFLKLNSFPAFFTIFACVLSSLIAVRLYYVLIIPSVSPSFRTATIYSSAMSLLVLMAWIAYIFRSRRVRLTFTRHVFFSPFFPFFQRIV